MIFIYSKICAAPDWWACLISSSLRFCRSLSLGICSSSSNLTVFSTRSSVARAFSRVSPVWYSITRTLRFTPTKITNFLIGFILWPFICPCSKLLGLTMILFPAYYTTHVGCKYVWWINVHMEYFDTTKHTFPRGAVPWYTQVWNKRNLQHFG